MRERVNIIARNLDKWTRRSISSTTDFNPTTVEEELSNVSSLMSSMETHVLPSNEILSVGCVSWKCELDFAGLPTAPLSVLKTASNGTADAIFIDLEPVSVTSVVSDVTGCFGHVDVSWTWAEVEHKSA